MGAFGGLTMTNKGRNLQTKAQTGVKLTFTRMAIGDGSLNGSSILELNALKNERKSLNITKLSASTSGRVLIGAILSNQDISAGFYFREIGIFASDPDAGEILYCYGNAASLADYIPAGSSGGTDLIEKSININVFIGNAANISAVIDQSLIYETPNGAQAKADTAEANAKAASIAKTEKGAAGGVPVLDTNGKIDNQYLPALAITDTFVVNSEAAMLALAAQKGDVAVRSDMKKSFILTAEPATTLTNWTELQTPTDAVLSVNGKTGTVTLTPADVGAASANDLAVHQADDVKHITAAERDKWNNAADSGALLDIQINMIDMAVELETLKGATLNGVTSNIFIETFQSLADINLTNGIFDSANKRLVL